MGLPNEVNSALIGAAAAVGGYQIEQSLKFTSDSGQYLYHDLSGTPSGTTYGALSCWIKSTRGGYFSPVNNGGFKVFEADSNPGSGSSGVDWYTNVVSYNPGSWPWGDMTAQSAANAKGVTNYWTYNTTQAYPSFRDLTGWHHYLIKWQSGDGTATRRQIVYINGVESVYFSYYGNIGSNEACYFTRNGYRISIGESSNSDFIMAECHCIDGQNVSYTDFVETDSITGEIKAKEYTGSYGNNGWYLKFDPSATNGIGHDHSGNGKHFTATGFTTSGNDTDVLGDSPTNNWCNFNGLYASQNRTTNRFDNGGLGYVSTGGGVVWATQVPNCPPIYQGKWYWEWVTNSVDAYIGLISDTVNVQTSSNTQSQSGTILYYAGDGNKRIDNTASSYGSSFRSTDLPNWSNYVGVALDKDNNTVTFYKSGVSQGSIALSSSSVDMVNRPVLPAFLLADASSRCNFGQFDFQMTPPSGYKAINQSNWPIPNIKNPSEHFNIVTWSGNNATSRSITGVGFQPDFVWIKRRNSNTYVHILFDVVRGAGNQFTTNGTAAELASGSNVAGKVTSFDSDGFTVGQGSNVEGVNKSGGTYVAYCWKAGGSGVSNTDGNVTSTVSVNQTAGFALVNYDSSASTKPLNVGHGLGEKPRFIMFKNRDSAGSWAIYHAEMGATKANALNSTSVPTTSVDYFNNTEPTDTVFTVYDSTPTHQYGTTNTCFAFAWAEKEGYSKFGRYTGNGNNDGTFVPCGFRPAWVLVKCFSTSGDDWQLWDDTRKDFNVTNLAFPVNVGSQEDTSDGGTATTGNYSIDICANGFKHKSLTTSVNGSGRTYLFAAFARCPWKYATGGSGRQVG